ncbi:MAG: glycosyltransferase [Candidatus Diapherotrites archaeon]|nr:glycosyltransferase [Candidatus Diapherotrites archaeon]
MISVVVPAYNERKTISKCLSAIHPQDCELIVVAGGSDGTAKVAKKYGRVIKDTKCIGAGAARNIGAAAAKGSVVLFTDGDTVVPPGWVEAYREVFRDKQVVAAGGVVEPLGGGVVDGFVFKLNQDWLYRFTAVFGLYQLSGNNCGYRKNEFLAEKGFDEGMSMLEDTELPMRMKKRGKVVVDRGICVRTSPRRMRENGYLATGIGFVKEYFSWLVLGRKPRRGYFASAKAKSY